MDVKKLILIGFMSSGKSSVAPLLADRLGFSSVDADEEIIRISGYRSIQDIFTECGEARFRELEATVAASYRDTSSLVIATGGGVVLNRSNMEHLTYNGGVVIFLQTDFEEVQRRVADTSTRPLFRDKVMAERIYRERQPLYGQYADYSVSTNGKTPYSVCLEVLAILGKQI